MNIQWTQQPAYQTLQELARHPFDLTEPQALSAERIARYKQSACGYTVSYGTERIDDQVMAALYALAEQTGAFSKMERMQKGETVNVIYGYESENRPALHTAVRDFFGESKAPKETSLAKKEVEKLRLFIEKIEQEKHFTDLIMVGIGGSDLGPKANTLALRFLGREHYRVHFISNVDPDDVASALKGVDLSRSLVGVTSKSGTTIETATNEALVRHHFVANNLQPEKHFIAITGEGSPMDRRDRYLECFYIWDWVGGRYSSCSMVGGVPLAFAYGFDVYWQFLQGASAMDQEALNTNPKQNLPLLVALLGIWNHNFLGCSTQALIPYSHALQRFPAHVQQLDMESNGKRIDQWGQRLTTATGPIIWGEPGTNSQHSFFQLIHQGKEPLSLEFIGYQQSQCGEDLVFQETTSQQKLIANLFAQVLSLAVGQNHDNPNKVFPGNRPSHMILGKQLTPYALGALLSLFEHKVAFQGFIWGVNSFDQEGVQLGKVLANKILDRMIAREQGGEDESYPEADALLKILEECK